MIDLPVLFASLSYKLLKLHTLDIASITPSLLPKKMGNPRIQLSFSPENLCPPSSPHTYEITPIQVSLSFPFRIRRHAQKGDQILEPPYRTYQNNQPVEVIQDSQVLLWKQNASNKRKCQRDFDINYSAV